MCRSNPKLHICAEEPLSVIGDYWKKKRANLLSSSQFQLTDVTWDIGMRASDRLRVTRRRRQCHCQCYPTLPGLSINCLIRSKRKGRQAECCKLITALNHAWQFQELTIRSLKINQNIHVQRRRLRGFPYNKARKRTATPFRPCSQFDYSIGMWGELSLAGPFLRSRASGRRRRLQLPRSLFLPSCKPFEGAVGAHFWTGISCKCYYILSTKAV